MAEGRFVRTSRFFESLRPRRTGSCWVRHWEPPRPICVVVWREAKGDRRTYVVKSASGKLFPALCPPTTLSWRFVVTVQRSDQERVGR
jgi:hypothetical protein